MAQAEAFLGDMEGRRETIESEPGIYRHTEVNGEGFKAFSLMSLLPKTGSMCMWQRWQSEEAGIRA